jgi:hypothetical protein
MPARLCLFGEPKAAVCVDVHITDRIHLKRDFHWGTPIIAVS